MLNQPESLTGPLSSRGRRRHVRTLLGVTTAQHVLLERPERPAREAADRDDGARLSLPTPAAPPRPRASELPDAPAIESTPWAPDGESLQARIERDGPLSLVEANALLAQLVDFSLHQPDDGLVHCPTTRRIRLLADTTGGELQLVGVDGEAPADEDYESVVFQLGAVLYAALTGEDPFPGKTPAQAHLFRAAGRFRPATHVNPALPAVIDDFFVRTFSVDHARRFASAFEMRSAFDGIARQTLPLPRAEESSELDIPIDVELESEVAPVFPPPARPPAFEVDVFEPPPSSFRVDDAVAAGLVVKGPKRTGRILFGMALLTAMSVAATTFIAREVEEPPTREETEELARKIQVEAIEVGEKVKEKVDATR
jgi:hypothetical protein